MADYDDFQNILLNTNFVGGANQNDLSTVSGSFDARADVVKDTNNIYQFYYYSLTILSDLNNLGYYDTPTNDVNFDGAFYDREYNELPSGNNPSLNPNQLSIISSVLSSNTYGGMFSDVAKINFNTGTTSSANIIFGATTNGGAVTNQYGGYELDYTDGDGELKHGDIWLNKDYDANSDGTGDWISTDLGSLGRFAITHEIAHSLGLKGDNDISGLAIDHQKYTVMSYNLYTGMDTVGSNNEVLPFGLQLLDIAAIQEIYGRNYLTRNIDTTYSKLNAFNSTRPNDAFIYTIWDGGGNADKIDVSGYTNPKGAIVDLRQGEFSSVGYNAEGGAAIDNLAIAYHTIIENAVGTAYSDILIGNAWDNRLEGGAGNDVIFGDGASVAWNPLVSQIKNSDDGYGIAEHESESGVAAASDKSGDDILIGGFGDDILIGGLGQNILDGYGGDPDIAIYHGAQTNGFDTVDYSFLNNSVSVVLDKKGNGTATGVVNDTLISIDNIIGSSAGDTIITDVAWAEITGGLGNDTITGGSTFHYTLGDGSDVIYLDEDFSDMPARLNIYGTTVSEVTYIRSGNDRIYNFTDGATITVKDVYDELNRTSVGLSTRDENGDSLSSQDPFSPYQNNNYENKNSTIYGLGDNPSTEVDEGKNKIDISGAISKTDENGIRIKDENGIVIIVKDYSVYGLDSSDNITIDSDGDNIIFGGLGNDSITTSAVGSSTNIRGDDIVYGGYGDDFVRLLGFGNSSVYGEEGDDLIRFGNGNNMIDGGAGNDDIFASNRIPTSTVYENLIYGGAGNDRIVASIDNDTIYGGEGDDLILGRGVYISVSEPELDNNNVGNDVLYGDEGDDVIIAAGLSQEIYGGLGNDVYVAYGNQLEFDSQRTSVITDNDGNNLLVFSVDRGFYDARDLKFNQINGNDLEITIEGHNQKVIINDYYLNQDAFKYIAFSYDDRIINNIDDFENGNIGLFTWFDDIFSLSDYINSTQTIIYGTVGTDTLNGSVNNDSIFAQAGDDLVSGGDGDDLIRGFLGADTLNGDSGDDTIDGGNGNDEINGGLGNDVIYGRDGFDVLAGGEGNDTIYGGESSDKIDGGAGNDIIYAGRYYDAHFDSFDLLEGFITDPNDGNNIISGGEGDDRIFGGVSDDFIDGKEGSDVIFSGAGNDFLQFTYGESGLDGDYYHGYTDGTDDTLLLNLDDQANNAEILAEIQDFKNNIWDYDRGNYFYFSTLNLYVTDFETVEIVSNVILGSENNDLIQDENTDDFIYAGYGDQVIKVGEGRDIIYGGSGNDIIQYEGNYQDYTITNLTQYFVPYFTIQDNFGSDGLDDVYNVEVFQFANGTYDVATETFTSNLNQIDGTSSNDTIYGTSSNDLIYGYEGIDTIEGLSGNDTIYGGDGNDKLYGLTDTYSGANSGDDTFYGGAGNDWIYANGGNDFIDGGDGSNDDVRYNYSHTGVNVNLLTGEVDENGDGIINDILVSIERVTGSKYDDVIIGDNAVNSLNGRGGNDNISGGGAGDYLYANNGDDVLYGGDGGDLLNGSSGVDILYGGAGIDTLIGGNDADTFVFEAASAYSGVDVIQDLDISEGDIIDLSDLLSLYDPLTDALSDFVSKTETSGHTYFAVDADGGADNFINVVRTHNTIGLSDIDILEANGNLITS